MFRLKTKYTFVSPAIIMMLLIMGVPLLISLKNSFFYYIISKPTYRPFIWFDNFKAILLDPQIHNSTLVTIKFSLGVLFVELLLGFLLAYCLTKIPKFNNAFLSVLIIPMMISSVAVGLIWRLLLHPDLGIINYLLDVIGLGGRPWLGVTSTALLTVMFIEVWRTTPFIMVIIYSAMLSMPTEPFEAATIDGATELQKLRYLTIPFIRPVVVVAATIRLIDLFRAYDLIYILTRGGPSASTETLSYYIFRLGFTNLDLGQASAASYLIVIIIGLATTFLFARLRGSQD